MSVDFNEGFEAGLRSATRTMQDRIRAMETQLTALQAENERLLAWKATWKKMYDLAVDDDSDLLNYHQKG